MDSTTGPTTVFKRVVSQLSPLSASGFIRWPQTFLLYAISHGFMLASWNALYWDDWMIYADGSAGVEDYFAACRRCIVPFRSEVEGLLISPGPWLMRVLTFLFFPLITFLSLQFLRRTAWMREDEMGVLSLLILFLPMYGARVALINFQYSLSLLIFVLGAWMSLSPRAAVQISAVVPIFWSMFTPSLQVFVVVPMAVLCVRLITRPNKSYLDRSTLLVIVLLGLSPFVHRYIIPIIFPTLGFRDGYNTIQSAFLVRAVVFSSLLVLPLLNLLNRRRLQQSVTRERALLSLGLAFLAVGTFPYLAVGHFPNLSDWILPFLPDESDWNSRHQLLQPFGVALILLVIARIFGTRMKAFVTVILTISVGLNTATYSGYYLDAMKQAELIQAIAESDAQLSNVSALVINDQATRFNARGRGIRAYEWTAMVTRAIDEKIQVDTNSIQYCYESKPSKMLTITAENGRLKSLFVGRIGLDVEMTDLTICS